VKRVVFFLTLSLPGLVWAKGESSAPPKMPASATKAAEKPAPTADKHTLSLALKK
jgi:hypothetical protein